ncbi:hydantoinase B/oxoprolinase family protein [Aureimonas fodinaquatilis]|uniref:Hydantoinase B/oxoprolinase family protein n=1 Tax=Aureimonas fodinaquatilis TaxID=2565783 RepID=A0A5B0DQX8_9HYPH|nr:hydantoinase B/oxoprolinase family protein [Aureimonas fodinaquatilis]KAA0968906.1 hydantoinase B/oxoprolinase family protein [Aureimonas fodinaquatilis]
MTQSAKLDPITVEVVRNKLEGIANEMQSTLLRASFSPIVREGLDASAGLFTVEGETLAQAIAIPIHLSTMIPVLEAIIKEFPRETMKEGDLYLMNDPYLGGTHLPDIGIVMPIFAEGELVAFSSSMTHHQDVGGMVAGSVPTNATSIYQEGLRLPPLKLRDGDKFDEGLIKILKLNSRIPTIFMGDIHAQISSCVVGANRIGELARTYGAAQARTIFATLLDRSEIMTRDALKAIPDGTYRYVDYNDNDGLDLDKRIRIEVAITIKDGTFHCDFTGSNPQVRGPFNVVRSGSLAAAFFVVRAITGADIPTNGGCLRPVTMEIPKGSILDPVEPAPVNARSATIKRVTGAMLGAMREAMPEVIGADAAGEMLLLMFGGAQEDGKPYVVGELIAGGSGAGPESDGVDVIETDATNCMNLPVEAIEMDAPIRMHRCSLRQDSGGAGTHRGGLGIVREYEILGDDVTFTHRGERHFVAASGGEGGSSGQCARTVIYRQDGSVETVPSKIVTQLARGDRIVVETAGGGGFGDPALRDPAALQEDVANGKVSSQAAESLYAVDKKVVAAA